MCLLSLLVISAIEFLIEMQCSFKWQVSPISSLETALTVSKKALYGTKGSEEESTLEMLVGHSFFNDML